MIARLELLREVQMGMIRAHDRGDIAPEGTAAEWAIGIVRRSFHGSRGCIAVPRNLPPFLAELETVGALFRAAQETMLSLQGAGLVIASPGALTFTRHERRLLQAVAAAQAENDALADNYLFKLAPHPRARPPLAHAVTALATTLATSGRWCSSFPLPASALPVARLHGADLQTISVAWPYPDRNSNVPR